MEHLLPAGPSEIADAFVLQRGAWIVVVFSPEAELSRGLKRLKAELDLLLAEEQEGEGSVHLVAAPHSSSDLLTSLERYSENDAVLLTGIEHLSLDELERLDLFRNRALHGPRVLLATTQEGAARLSTTNPNFWSWIGARCMKYDASEGVMNKGERLQSLRDHFELSDADVLEMAQRHALPDDVAFAEWLILLGRGDLLGA